MTDARTEAVDAVYELAHLVLDREQVEWIIDRLILPRVVPCSECGGTGGVADYYSLEGAENGFESPCGECNGTGEVSLPPLAVLMGDWQFVEHRKDVVRWEESDTGMSSWPAEVDEYDLYRTPAGESSPNTGPKEQR